MHSLSSKWARSIPFLQVVVCGLIRIERKVRITVINSPVTSSSRFQQSCRECHGKHKGKGEENQHVTLFLGLWPPVLTLVHSEVLNDREREQFTAYLDWKLCAQWKLLTSLKNKRTEKVIYNNKNTEKENERPNQRTMIGSGKNGTNRVITWLCHPANKILALLFPL